MRLWLTTAVICALTGCALPSHKPRTIVIKEPPVIRGVVVAPDTNQAPSVISTVTEGRSSVVVVPQTVKLRWSWSPSPGAVGYRVYTGGPTPNLRPGTYTTVATVTQASFTNTAPIHMGSSRLYIVVRSIGANGSEGEPSGEAVWPKPPLTQLVMVLPVAKASIYAGPNLGHLTSWAKVADVTNGRWTNTTGVAPTMMFAASTNWPTLLKFRWERQ